MRALVVYESMFGNTKAVAEAVADGLSSRIPAKTVEVGEAGTFLDDDLSVLVVGGPTHAFGMSRRSTRADAAREGVPLVSATGVRGWLAEVASRPTVRAASFDTKVYRPRLPGSAAHGIRRQLRRKGFEVVAAHTFFVDGKKGPLHPGEADRARQWGEELATTLR